MIEKANKLLHSNNYAFAFLKVYHFCFVRSSMMTLLNIGTAAINQSVNDYVQ